MNDSIKQLNISVKFRAFLENLSEQAFKTDRLPFIGREKEIELVLETLMRRLKHNVLLVGESGVGKTALITEVAARINQGKVPPPLIGKIILEFSLNRFFYSRDSGKVLLKDLEQFLSEIMGNKYSVILFLDEMQLHSVPESEKMNWQEQVHTVLRSYVTDREMSIITTATPENYYKTIKNDEILALNFCPILIDEPNPTEMLDILKGVAPYFEHYYSLTVPDHLFERIVYLLQKFTPHRSFPHKAIDLLDVCCSRVALKQRQQLDIEIIYQSISDIVRLPIDVVKLDPIQHRLNIHEFLESKMVNQREAIEEISRIIKLSGLESEMRKSRPEGIFLFLGVPGVGKSFMARKLAEYLFGSKEKLRVIDLASYKQPEDFKKLVGDTKAKPGLLIEEVDAHPFSVIFFEHIDMAEESVLNMLGKTLVNSEIIDAAGKKHHISNIIFILSLTSVGEEKIETPIGFITDKMVRCEITIAPKINNLLDWVDEIIHFTPLAEEDLQEIANSKMNDITIEIKEKYNTDVFVGDGVFSNISQESIVEGGFAHTVAEKLDRQIKHRLLDMINKVPRNQKFEVTMKNNEIKIMSK